MFGDDPIEQMGRLVKDVDAEDRREWSSGARSEQLVELLKVAERLQAAIVRSVSDWAPRTDWALDGALSPRTWLTHRAPITAVGTSKLVGMARLARHCSVTRVLMRGESEVLDLGRSTRLASAAQHKALAIRDRGCVFPGCDRPPAWCNAHHLVWWEHDGPTDIQNLCLLCRRHHTLCHEGGWGLTRNADGTYEAHEPPAGHTPSRTRRPGRAPPTAE